MRQVEKEQPSRQGDLWTWGKLGGWGEMGPELQVWGAMIGSHRSMADTMGTRGPFPMGQMAGRTTHEGATNKYGPTHVGDTSWPALGNHVSSHWISEGPGWGICGQGTVWPEMGMRRAGGQRQEGGRGRPGDGCQAKGVGVCLLTLPLAPHHGPDSRQRAFNTQCAGAGPGRVRTQAHTGVRTVTSGTDTTTHS